MRQRQQWLRRTKCVATPHGGKRNAVNPTASWQRERMVNGVIRQKTPTERAVFRAGAGASMCRKRR